MVNTIWAPHKFKNQREGGSPTASKDTKVSNVRRGSSAVGPRCPSSAQLRAECLAWGYPALGLSEAPAQLPPPRASPGRCSAAPASSAAPGSSSRGPCESAEPASMAALTAPPGRARSCRAVPRGAAPSGPARRRLSPSWREPHPERRVPGARRLL